MMPLKGKKEGGIDRQEGLYPGGRGIAGEGEGVC